MQEGAFMFVRDFCKKWSKFFKDNLMFDDEGDICCNALIYILACILIADRLFTDKQHFNIRQLLCIWIGSVLKTSALVSSSIPIMFFY